MENQTDAWDHAGPRRNPRFDDGAQVDEQLTEYTAGSSFAYQLTATTTPLPDPATAQAQAPAPAPATTDDDSPDPHLIDL